MSGTLEPETQISPPVDYRARSGKMARRVDEACEVRMLM